LAGGAVLDLLAASFWAPHRRRAKIVLSFCLSFRLSVALFCQRLGELAHSVAATTARSGRLGLAELEELIALAQKGTRKPIKVTRRKLPEASAVLSDLKASKVVGRIVLLP
jgi:hypothetical protein